MRRIVTMGLACVAGGLALYMARPNLSGAVAFFTGSSLTAQSAIAVVLALCWLALALTLVLLALSMVRRRARSQGLARAEAHLILALAALILGLGLLRHMTPPDNLCCGGSGGQISEAEHLAG